MLVAEPLQRRCLRLPSLAQVTLPTTGPPVFTVPLSESTVLHGNWSRLSKWTAVLGLVSFHLIKALGFSRMGITK